MLGASRVLRWRCQLQSPTSGPVQCQLASSPQDLRQGAAALSLLACQTRRGMQRQLLMRKAWCPLCVLISATGSTAAQTGIPPEWAVSMLPQSSRRRQTQTRTLMSTLAQLALLPRRLPRHP